MPADIPALSALLSVLFAQEADFQPDPAKHATGLELLFARQLGDILLAEADGGVRGMVSLLYTVSTALGAAGDCDYGNRRSVYIAPTGGSWLAAAGPGAVVTVTIRGSEVRDLSQLPGHPAGMGVHVLAKDITVQAKLLPEAPAEYGGVPAGDVVDPSGC